MNKLRYKTQKTIIIRKFFDEIEQNKDKVHFYQVATRNAQSI